MVAGGLLPLYQVVLAAAPGARPGAGHPAHWRRFLIALATNGLLAGGWLWS
jgi:hypothetical protein